MRPGRRQAGPRDSDGTAAAIERFLNSTRNPALLEPGEEPIPLLPGAYELSLANGRLILAAWSSERNVSRRITALVSERPGRIELSIEKLGGRAGAMTLLDLDRPRNQAIRRHGARLVYRERLRSSLARQFPHWKIVRLSAEADLEHSLSPAYPRALLRRGKAGLAVIGAPAGGADADGALTYGLIWLDYLRKNEPRLFVEGLALFLPEDGTETSCLRLRHLDWSVAQYSVYVHSADGQEDRIDPRDHGNLKTALEVCAAPRHALDADWLERLRTQADVECIEQRDGEISLRVRGLEFARGTPQGLVFGIETKRLAPASNLAEVEEVARLLARMRSPGAADRRGALYLKNPEAWLESQVRRNLETIDATLWPDPVYGQVPAVTGCQRGLIDLLGSAATAGSPFWN